VILKIRSVALILPGIGALALAGQLIVMPIVLGMMMDGLSGVLFGFVYCYFMSTLFGFLMVVWNTLSVACFALGIWLILASPQQTKRNAKRVVGVMLTLVPALLFALVLFYAEGHAV
jgi:hypothetical protein